MSTTDKYPLESFQIFYTVSEGDYSVSFNKESMDRMTLLDVTKRHLESCFATDSLFSRIFLYFSVRSDEMFQNGTKIAFGGNAYFLSSSSSSGTTQNDENTEEEDAMIESIATNSMLCFLGQNETIYVESLRQALGWTVLQRAQLMTVAGGMVEYTDDGTMIMPSDDNGGAAIEPTKSMEKSTSLGIYLVSVLVPLVAVVLLATGWCCYRMRTNLALKASDTADPKSPIWCTEHPQNHALRQATTMQWYKANHPPTTPVSVAVDEGVATQSDRGTVGPALQGKNKTKKSSAQVSPAAVVSTKR